MKWNTVVVNGSFGRSGWRYWYTREKTMRLVELSVAHEPRSYLIEKLIEGFWVPFYKPGGEGDPYWSTPEEALSVLWAQEAENNQELLDAISGKQNTEDLQIRKKRLGIRAQLRAYLLSTSPEHPIEYDLLLAKIGEEFPQKTRSALVKMIWRIPGWNWRKLGYTLYVNGEGSGKNFYVIPLTVPSAIP